MVIGIIFIILGIAYIIFFIRVKINDNTSIAFKIRGIGAGIIAIITGIAFVCGFLKS